MLERFFSKSNDISPKAPRKKSPGSAEAEQAEVAAMEGEKTGNRIYRLKHDRADDDATRPLRFIAVGCQGSGDKDQRKVAKLMHELSANPDTRPDFVLILGDNVYDWGADSADDTDIGKCFDDIYLTPELTSLHNMPFFVILGNHDENRQNSVISKLKSESGVVRGMHEVAHSYMEDKKFGAAAKKLLYQDSTVFHLNNMPSWNMPHRYYSLIAGDVQIFCIDSNTYVKDYLDLLNYPNRMNDTNNQAAWLATEVAAARANGRKVILAQHHPLYTPGKRAYHNDLGIYLEKAEILDLPNRFGIPADAHTSYNIFLTETMRQQKLTFDVTLAAHDHNIYYYNNKTDDSADYKICQITAGGGGGLLQERAKFTEQDQMGCFLKKHGVSVISHAPGSDDFEFALHTADHEHQLEFNSRSHEAVIHLDESNPEKPDIEKFFAVVESALNAYLGFLGDKQDDKSGHFLSKKYNLTHGNEGTERAHQLWAYLKHPHPTSYAEIVSDIYQIVEWKGTLTLPAAHSLITILDHKMRQVYGNTMDEFVRTQATRAMILDFDIDVFSNYRY